MVKLVGRHLSWFNTTPHQREDAALDRFNVHRAETDAMPSPVQSIVMLTTPLQTGEEKVQSGDNGISSIDDWLEMDMAAVAEWYRHRIVAGFVTSSSPVPLKTRRVGQRCTLNLSRAEMSSRWCGVVVRRGGASSSVVHVT
ncbi:uncharacterized protein TNCV_1635341 [Trichonephila clavipes]|nr:uncharacterized protein TNCV_1635341 [Trichonephila clavipes]